MTESQYPELNQFFNDIKSKSTQVSCNAIKTLQEFTKKHRDANDYIFTRLSEMISKSTEKNETINALKAVSKIKKVIRETQTTHFVIKFLTPSHQQVSSKDRDITDKAVECCGELVKLGGTHMSDTITAQLDAAWLWIKEIKEDKYPALKLLKEYISRVPTLCYSKIFSREPIYHDLLNLLKNDSRQDIREAANELLRAAIELLLKRDEQLKKDILYTIYNNANNLIKNQEKKGILVGIKIMNILIDQAGVWIKEKFREVTEFFFKYCTTFNSSEVKDEVSFSIGLLATLSPEEFEVRFLKPAMDFLLEIVSKRSSKNYGQAFVVIGQISSKVSISSFENYLAKMIDAFDYELLRGRKPFALEVLTGIRLAFINYGNIILDKNNIDAWLDSMMSVGFCKSLIDVLKQMCEADNTNIVRLIKIRILNGISFILTNKVFDFSSYLLRKNLHKILCKSDKIFKFNSTLNLRKSTAILKPNDLPNSLSNQDFKTFDNAEFQNSPPKSYENDKILPHRIHGTVIPSKINANAIKDDYFEGTPDIIPDKGTIKQISEKVIETLKEYIKIIQSDPQKYEQALITALEMLCTFNFQEFTESLVQFVEQGVLEFLVNESPKIRKAAIRTGCSLYIQNANHISSVEEMINQILMRFLNVAIIDPDFKIRIFVLRYLSSRFDAFLASKDNLMLLFQCTNNNVFEVKLQAFKILGRLLDHNPSFVIPFLRKSLVELMNIVVNSFDERLKEESATLISELLSSTKDMCEHYTNSILNLVLSQLLNANNSTSYTIALIENIGILSYVNQNVIKENIKKIIPIILQNMDDQGSPIKREISAKALNSIIVNTKYVMKPYAHYPQIINQIRRLVQNEVYISVRMEILKLLGSLGAIDPYKMKHIQIISNYKELGTDKDLLEAGKQILGDLYDKSMESNYEKFQTSNIDLSIVLDEKMPGKVNGINSMQDENFYTSMAIKALMRVLLKPTLKDHYQVALSAVNFILGCLTSDNMPFLPIIISPMVHLIQTGEDSLKNILFKHLKKTLKIVNDPPKKHIGEIFDLIYKFFEKPQYLVQVLKLVKIMTINLKSSIKEELPRMIPILLKIIKENSSRQSSIEQNVDMDPCKYCIKILMELSELLDNYLHNVMPSLINLLVSIEFVQNFELKSEILEVFKSLIKCEHFKDYLATIIHPLTRLIDQASYQNFGVKIVGIFSQIISVFQLDFAIYIPLIIKVLNKHNIKSKEFETEVAKLFTINSVSVLVEANKINNKELKSCAKNDNLKKNGGRVLLRERKVDCNSLLNAFDADKCELKEDWEEWHKKTSIELLKQSPYPVLYACSSIAQLYSPISEELFNLAFVGIWNMLQDSQKENLIAQLYSAFKANYVPNSILQNLLSLAEYMDHGETPLPIETNLLGQIAEKCNAFAKALYYRETEFESNPSESIESLITINFELHQPEAAMGILLYAQKNLKIDLKEEWNIKLHRFEDALLSYNIKLSKNSENVEAQCGKMICLKELQLWEELLSYAETKAPKNSNYNSSPSLRLTRKRSLSSESKYSMIHDVNIISVDMCVAAAWNLSQWDKLTKYVEYLEEQTYDKSFYKAILEIRKENYAEGLKQIHKAREILDNQLISMFSESYLRAYNIIFDLQQLKELEEIIEYKTNGDSATKIHLQALWNDRINHIQKDITMWQKEICIRRLVFSPSEDVDCYLKYASICRHEGKNLLASKIIENLEKEIDPKNRKYQAKIEYAKINCLYNNNNINTAITRIQKMINDDKYELESKLKARCFLKLGLWEKNLKNFSSLNDKAMESIINNFQKATQFDSSYFQAWQAYSIANYDALSYYEEIKKVFIPNVQKIENFAIAAVTGLVKSISLGGNNITKTLQNLLRLLKIWFNYGDNPEIEAIISSGFGNISLEVWMNVLPQILARINIENESTQKQLFNLLEKMGKEHPQALIYQISVVAKSASEDRRICANKLISKMQLYSAVEINQCLQVSSELIRAAILLHEQWFEAIEEATRMHFSNANLDAALSLLYLMHKKMYKEPETMNEINFHQNYSCMLKEAENWLNIYMKDKNDQCLNQAWEIYYTVYKMIYEQIKEMKSLDLINVSPQLLEMKNLEISVPGIYKSGESIVKIASFDPILPVLSSKQHPRQLSLLGSDEKSYIFLLKGHEDNRQDERAMQLFGLVNTLLAIDPKTQKKDLSISRFAVVPLSPNAGLIGWVSNCDTLNALIQQNRTNTNVLLRIEVKLMTSMCPTYENAPLVNKIEIFRHAIDNTYGQDLCKVLWNQSTSSELWLERRTNFTRSHAVMCMVGYILGLGDRHPSNIMIHRLSGKIVHIDFGDCFEVANSRDKFPEKIPFRLTRMLVKAMEVSGIEGNFRTTCEKTMKVLRENRDSLFTILESFIYDPLISFKLITPKIAKQTKKLTDKTPKPDNVLKDNLKEKFNIINQDDEKRKVDDKEKEIMILLGPEGLGAEKELLNMAVQFAMERIKNKLSGKEFRNATALDVKSQVDKLIQQATSDENLAQCYIGWCPYW